MCVCVSVTIDDETTAALIENVPEILWSEIVICFCSSSLLSYYPVVDCLIVQTA